MYNIGRFGRIRFNVRSNTEEAVTLSGAMHAAFYAAMFASLDTYIDGFGAAHVEAKSIISRGVPITQAANAQVLAKAKGYAQLYAAGKGEGRIMAAVTVEITANLIGEFAAVIAQRTQLITNSYATGAGQAETRAKSRLSKNVYWPPQNAAAIFDGTVGVTKFNMTYATFDVAVPPGAKLVIDSAGYVVLLDGEDVIWAHEGEWLLLSRRTHDVMFQAAGELAIDRQILYTERWL